MGSDEDIDMSDETEETEEERGRSDLNRNYSVKQCKNSELSISRATELEKKLSGNVIKTPTVATKLYNF
jgi:hypothetical protein